MLVYTMRFSENNWNETDSLLMNYVSSNRKNKIVRYKFEVDRKLSLYGALLVRMGIARITNCSHANLRFETNKNGKAFLVGNDSLFFNLSHTRNALICAFSQFQIGADVEKIVDPYYSIMNSCFHPDEIDSVHQCIYDKKEKFFEIWTRKEAYTKYNGIGICQDMTKINTFDDRLKFFTWIDHEYIFSIYSENDTCISKFEYQTQDNLCKFYLQSFQ